MLTEQESETRDKNQTSECCGRLLVQKTTIFLFENLKEDFGHLVQASYDVSGSGPEEGQHYFWHNCLKSKVLVHGANKFDYPLKEEQAVKMFNITVNERLTRARPV